MRHFLCVIFCVFLIFFLFRTVKSNETKSKKTFDKERVLHQVKYLGLLENIKVRRAGFAFRQEFHTFNERYKYLGKGTLTWKGDDASRCKAILKEVSEALGLTKDQAQIGRSKLFLKQPQTLFQLEKLRSKKFGAFAKVGHRPAHMRFDAGSERFFLRSSSAPIGRGASARR